MKFSKYPKNPTTFSSCIPVLSELNHLVKNFISHRCSIQFKPINSSFLLIISTNEHRHSKTRTLSTLIANAIVKILNYRRLGNVGILINRNKGFNWKIMLGSEVNLRLWMVLVLKSFVFKCANGRHYCENEWNVAKRIIEF